MSALVLGFPECADSARRLAGRLDLPCGDIALHRFPDGESLVRIPDSADTVVLYRSLDDPNGKLVELLLAASAARDGGAGKVLLVAPYLAYMRQDIAFRPGEAVSQRVIGQLLADHCDALVTVDPHLHRIATLGEAVPGIPAISVSAAPLLAGLIDAGEAPVIVGPDSESRQWTSSIAGPLGLDMLCGSKDRRGDRDVAVRIAGVERVAGRVAILVDDVISSGETLMAAARSLLEAGASRIDALATHCLSRAEDLARMHDAGISHVACTDSIAGPTARAQLAPLLAEAIRRNDLLGS